MKCESMYEQIMSMKYTPTHMNRRMYGVTVDDAARAVRWRLLSDAIWDAGVAVAQAELNGVENPDRRELATLETAREQLQSEYWQGGGRRDS